MSVISTTASAAALDVYAPSGLSDRAVDALSPGEAVRPLLLQREKPLTFADLQAEGIPDVAELLDGLDWRGAHRHLTSEQLATQLPALIMRRLRDYISSCTKRHRAILAGRLCIRPKKTLRALASALSISSERVRQDQVMLSSQIDHRAGAEAMILAGVLRRSEFGTMALEDDIKHLLAELFVAPGDEPLLAALCAGMVSRRLGYKTSRNGVCADDPAVKKCREIEEGLADHFDDARLVPLKVISASLLRGTRLKEVLGFLGLCRIGRVYVSRRATAKARVKAALLEIGRPATREEIALKSGLDEHRTGLQLSSLSSVIKKDKKHWSIRSSEDEDHYAGVWEEISKTIEDSGGSAEVEDIRLAFPKRFGVKAETVDAYLATHRFVVKEGRVRLSDLDSVIGSLRPLDQVVSGFNDMGLPYWDFPFNEKMLKGYSVTGVACEFVYAAGCLPDERSKPLVLDSPETGIPLTASWCLSSTSYASIGHLSEALTALQKSRGEDFDAGDWLRLTLVEPGRVRLDVCPADQVPQGRAKREAEHA